MVKVVAWYDNEWCDHTPCLLTCTLLVQPSDVVFVLRFWLRVWDAHTASWLCRGYSQRVVDLAELTAQKWT